MGEVVDVPRKLILIDPEKRGNRYATAHALAHLDLEHVSETGGGAFTAEEEADADWLARLRLDDPADNDPGEQRAPAPATPRTHRFRGLLGRAVVLSFALAVLAIFLPGAPIFDGAQGGDSSAWATSPDVRQPSPLHCSLGCPGDSNSVRVTPAPILKPHHGTAINKSDHRGGTGSVGSRSGSGSAGSSSGTRSSGGSAGGSTGGGLHVTIPNLDQTPTLDNLPKLDTPPNFGDLPNLDQVPKLGDVHVDATIPPLGQSGQSELSVGVGSDQNSERAQIQVDTDSVSKLTDPVSKLTGIH